MSAQTPGAQHGTYRDPRGNPVPYDGATPVTWRVGAYVLVERGGRVLMIESLQSGRWELPGGGGESRRRGAAGIAQGPGPINLRMASGSGMRRDNASTGRAATARRQESGARARLAEGRDNRGWSSSRRAWHGCLPAQNCGRRLVA
jgi:hypothetical protein